MFLTIKTYILCTYYCPIRDQSKKILTPLQERANDTFIIFLDKKEIRKKGLSLSCLQKILNKSICNEKQYHALIVEI